MITRRRFLKHLSCFYALALVAPAATIEPMGSMATEATAGKWVNLEVPYPLHLSPIEGDSALEGNEEALLMGYEDVRYLTQRRKPYKNLLFHKSDGKKFKSIGP